MSGQTQPGFVEVPSARLHVRDASGAILSLHLARDERVVGADPAADLAVTDPAVSRRHFAVRLTEHSVLARDPESKNGLYVDRTRVLDGYCSIGSVYRLLEQHALQPPGADCVTTACRHASSRGRA